MNTINQNRTERRKKRVSKGIVGTAEKPRISVFRSNRFIYAQVIDDVKKQTVCFFSSHHLIKDKDYKKGKKTDESKMVGRKLAERMKEKNISSAVFDRGQYAYNGRVKAIAEGLREEGIVI